ncbi:MAG: hypothetical protein WC770_00865 [Phycisphaerae bacterium]
MAKKKNVVVGVLVTIVVLLVVAALASLFFIDGILKVAIEKEGTKQLGVGVSVEKVHLNIFNGSIAIAGLKIKNPAGYQYENMLEVASISAKADTGSLFSDVVEVNQIDINDIAVVIEQKGTVSNLSEVLKNTKGDSEAKPTPAPAEKKGKNVHIASLDIADIGVTAKLLPIPGKADSVKLKIAKLHLSDIGGKETSLGEATGKIFKAISAAIASQGAGIIPADMVGSINDSLAGIGKTGEEILKSTGADKEIQKAAEGLKGLFKKKEQP